MTYIHGILAQFSQSTRLLHVESFNPELIFLLDHPNNSSHPAPYIRWLITFTLGNRHEVRVWFGSHTLLNPINITCQYIIKFYLQYVHSFMTIEYINIYNNQVSQIVNHIISYYGHAHVHVPPTNMSPHLINRLAVIRHS